MSIFIGVNDKSRKVKQSYIGVDGVARKIKYAYIGGDDGKARLIPLEHYIKEYDSGNTFCPSCQTIYTDSPSVCASCGYYLIETLYYYRCSCCYQSLGASNDYGGFNSSIKNCPNPKCGVEFANSSYSLRNG